jgi:hypothetical protein
VGAAHPEDLAPLPGKRENRGKGLTLSTPRRTKNRSNDPDCRAAERNETRRGGVMRPAHMCHSPPRQSAELGHGINVSVVAGGLGNGPRLALVVAARPVCRETRRASSRQRTLKVAWPSSCP